MSKAEVWSKRSIKTVFCLMFAVMLLFNFLTPLVSDDFNYMFSFATNERIKNIADIGASMAAHRTSMNGRVFAHALVQLFLLLPKAVFNFVNSFSAVLIMLLMLHFVRTGSQKRDLFLLLCGIFMIWYFTPDYGQVYLWLDGACNYSWAMGFSLLFLRHYYDIYMNEGDDTAGGISKILFFPLALIAGGYSESASCAMLFLAACFIVLIRIRSRHVPARLIAGFAAGCVGFLFMMSAPAELGDRGVFSPGLVLFNLNYVILSLKYYQIGLYCIFAALLALCAAVHADKRKILLALLFTAGGVVSAGVFSFAKYCPARALCPITTYTVIGCMLLISGLLEAGEKKIVSALGAVLAVLFLTEFMIGANDIITIYGESQVRMEMIQQAKENGNSVLELRAYNPQTKYSGVTGLEDVSVSPGNWVNTSMARYYGFDSVVRAGS